jgi:hypothetical protein
MKDKRRLGINLNKKEKLEKRLKDENTKFFIREREREPLSKILLYNL